MIRTANSIEEVVTSGLCIGCGLCEAISGGKAKMVMTDYGSLRPTVLNELSKEQESQLLSSCPGILVEPREEPGTHDDPIWGSFVNMQYAWATNPDIRFRGATGGVLTALGVHLLRSETIKFILQVTATEEHPMCSHWVLNESPEEVIASAGSRYAPTAPLAGLITALDRQEPFAIIAKPCDMNAVHRYSRLDPRVDQYCVARLVMVCGGQSRLKKSLNLLEELGIDESELSLFRHRGYGNPGPTRVETRDGRAYEKTYLELWADESGWELETRCKLCPDPLGEAADIAAADVWPGGSPSGEDAGFNGIIVRNAAAQRLVEEAVSARHLTLGDHISTDQFDDFQPHQVRKKVALTARYEGMLQSGMPAIDTPGLRLEKLGQRLNEENRNKQIEGTKQRIRQGRFAEPVTKPAP